MAHYKPYSSEWHRKRYLKEAIDKYLDEQIDNEVILNDLSDILSERSERAYEEFSRINDLESMLNAK
jgi:nucleoid-associated protein YejK